MSTSLISARDLSFNRHGFLAVFSDWDEEVAKALAAEEGLALTPCHWSVIQFMRDYYRENDIPPSPRIIVKGVGDRVSPHAPCRRKHLEALFPNGGCRQACRIAGLPRHYCHSC